MQIFHDLNEWQLFRKSLPTELSLGFAPTMGNLHIGHLSLFAASQKENDRTVSSLFVNPTQFNQADDFTHYPRTLDRDLQLMIEAGVDYCLLPTEQFMYADGYRYQVQENQQSQVLEGTKRPGHFTGVLTVVMKLFNLVKPHRAYFGEKDYQQLQLIRDMTSAFFMDIEVIACPTIRETSGLACSSRNNRLTQEQHLIAEQFAKTFHKNGLSCQELIDELEKLNIEVEYLEELKNRRFAAIKIGDVRLIDNYELSYS